MAPVTVVPAPVTVVPAPVTVVPAPVTVVPAPVTVVPAPVTVVLYTANIELLLWIELNWIEHTRLHCIANLQITTTVSGNYSKHHSIIDLFIIYNLYQ